MQNLKFLLIATAMVIMTVVMANAFGSKAEPVPEDSLTTEDTPFDKMMAVLTHKRCVNCHPAGDRPHQGEDSHVHNFGVQRGEDNHGVAALRCESCHSHEN